MVSFTVRMRFDAEDREQVTELLRSLAEESRREPGCVVYVPHRVEGEPDTVLIYEQYADGAALDAHKASAHYPPVRNPGAVPIAAGAGKRKSQCAHLTQH